MGINNPSNGMIYKMSKDNEIKGNNGPQKLNNWYEKMCYNKNIFTKISIR